MATQELHSFTGVNVTGQMFEVIASKSVQRFKWPDASALLVECGFSCKLRAEYASQTSRVPAFWALHFGAPSRFQSMTLTSRR